MSMAALFGIFVRSMRARVDARTFRRWHSERHKQA
jgi:hypothetical protein